MHPNCLWNELASCFKDSLNQPELDSIVEKSSNTTFKFGDGKSVSSLKKVILPTVIGNTIDNTTGQEKNEMKDNLDRTGHDLRTTNVLSGLTMCCLNINSLVKHLTS